MKFLWKLHGNFGCHGNRSWKISNESYLFIKLEPVKQIKRFESCLFYLNSNTNTSSIKTKGFKQLKTNTLLKQSGYWKIFKDYQTDVESKSDVVVNFTVCLAQIVCAKKK